MIERADTPSSYDKTPDAEIVEAEIIHAEVAPTTSLETRKPPGRRPIASLHVIPPLTDEEISILAADPTEAIRRRVKDYINWGHAMISASPSKLNRAAFGVESQRRMVDKFLSLAIPPPRVTGDPLGEMRQSTSEELIAIWNSMGPLPSGAVIGTPPPRPTRDALEAGRIDTTPESDES